MAIAGSCVEIVVDGVLLTREEFDIVASDERLE
jgi:hypothetical protein